MHSHAVSRETEQGYEDGVGINACVQHASKGEEAPAMQFSESKY